MRFSHRPKRSRPTRLFVFRSSLPCLPTLRSHKLGDHCIHTKLTLLISIRTVPSRPFPAVGPFEFHASYRPSGDPSVSVLFPPHRSVVQQSFGIFVFPVRPVDSILLSYLHFCHDQDRCPNSGRSPSTSLSSAPRVHRSTFTTSMLLRISWLWDAQAHAAAPLRDRRLQVIPLPRVLTQHTHTPKSSSSSHLTSPL